MSLDFIKFHLPIKKFMIGYLALILIYSSFSFRLPIWIAKGLLIVFIYSLLDLFWTYWKKKIWYLPLSSVISGLILALVGAINSSWILIVLMPLVAVISKQFIKLGKPRHIFNPAAFSLIMFSIFGFSATWWAVNWSEKFLLIIAIVGAYIIWRIRKWEIVLSFLLFYFLALSLIVGEFYFRLWDGTLLFFISVILIEPITSAFHNLKAKMVYGISAGAFAGLLTYFVSNFSNVIIQSIDPLLAGLLLANLLTSLLFL